MACFFGSITWILKLKSLNILPLACLNIPYRRVGITVTKKVDGKPTIQFERLVGEVTSYLDTRFLRVPRSGAQSRFLPVKDPAELESRRPEIEAVCQARGMLP